MVDPRYDAAFQPGYEEPPPGETRDRRNPWLVVLWGLAVILIAAGAFAVTQTGAGSGTGESVVPALVLPVVFAALAPWLVGSGLAALVGAVFVQAFRWRG